MPSAFNFRPRRGVLATFICGFVLICNLQVRAQTPMPDAPVLISQPDSTKALVVLPAGRNFDICRAPA